MSPIYYSDLYADGAANTVTGEPPCPGCGVPGGGRYAISGQEPVCWPCHQKRMGGDGSIPEPDDSDAGYKPSARRVNLAAVEKLRVLDTRKLVTTEPEPLDWLAEGVFCRGELTLFGGREKRGKSLVQLAVAVTMASGGGEIAGIEVKAGRVLIVDAENGEREVHRRLRAMGLALEHAENLTICEARGFDLREDLELAAKLAARHEADLVVFDSFRALWRGDERDEAEVAAALDPMRELAHDTERACSMTHHQQKGGEEYRGSSAIGGASTGA